MTDDLKFTKGPEELREKNASQQLDLNNDSGEERRKALRSILVGGGAITAAATSDKWAKPVIDSLVLPAHAQMSPDTMTDDMTDPMPVNNPVGDFSNGGATTLFVPSSSRGSELLADESISEELLEFFIPAAQAGMESSGGFCGPNCSVEINATFSSTKADFCVAGIPSGYVLTSVTTPVSGIPSMDNGFSLSEGPNELNVLGGTFNDGTGNWDLDVLDYTTNASIVVELTPGGYGCLPD